MALRPLTSVGEGRSLGEGWAIFAQKEKTPDVTPRYQQGWIWILDLDRDGGSGNRAFAHANPDVAGALGQELLVPLLEHRVEDVVHEYVAFHLIDVLPGIPRPFAEQSVDQTPHST